MSLAVTEYEGDRRRIWIDTYTAVVFEAYRSGTPEKYYGAALKEAKAALTAFDEEFSEPDDNPNGDGIDG